MTTTNRLANLALAMGLTPHDAVALPSVITKMAKDLKWTEARAISAIERQKPLRDYLAGVCREVMASHDSPFRVMVVGS